MTRTGNQRRVYFEKAESSFESYSGDNVSVIGQTKIYAKNKHDSAVHDHKDLPDCQRERSPSSWAMQHANGLD